MYEIFCKIPCFFFCFCLHTWGIKQRVVTLNVKLFAIGTLLVNNYYMPSKGTHWQVGQFIFLNIKRSPIQ